MGNFEGFFRNDNGQSDPGISSLYDYPTNDPTYTAIGGQQFGYVGDIRFLGASAPVITVPRIAAPAAPLRRFAGKNMPAPPPHPLPAGARPDRAHAPLGLRRVSRPGAACLAPLVQAKTRDGWVIFGRGSGSNPGHAGRSRESLRRATRGLDSVLDKPAPVNPHPADRARFRARRFGRDIDLTVGRERHSTDSPRGQSSIARCPRPASIV